jgi:hypothetical protein
MQRVAFARFALLSTAAAPVLLSGCGPSTYGTGQVPEMAILREVSGGLLSTEQPAAIDYSPRAPLVVPPSTGALPPPVASAAAPGADWPGAPDAPPVVVAERTTYGSDDEEETRTRGRSPLASFLRARQEAVYANLYGTSGQVLTAPPPGLAVPAPTAPVQEPPRKPFSLFHWLRPK